MPKPTLESPFKHTKELQGRTYVPVHEVVDRLNCVLGVEGWSDEVTCWQSGDYVLSKARITLHPSGVYREAYAGQAINKNKAGEVIDLSDDFKGAGSRALVKAASYFGVALYIALGHPPLPKGDESSGTEDAPLSSSSVPVTPVPPSGPVADDLTKRAAKAAPPRERSAMPRGDG